MAHASLLNGGILSIDDAGSPDGDWTTSMMLFKDTLKILSSSVPDQIDSMGGDNAAWELRQDAIDFSEAIENSAKGRIANEMQKDIKILINALKQLPESAYQCEATQALKHPQWEFIKKLAKDIWLRTERYC